jgi:uncharacterized protein (TIGR03067 family)
MKTIAASLGLVLSWAAASWGADEKDLSGTWLAAEAQANGAKLPADFVKKSKIVFADGKFTAFICDDTDEGTFTIDRAKKPNAIDMTSKALKGATYPGIFELQGDTLKVCWNMETYERPKDFTSTAANKQYVVVYKRKK